MKNFIITSKVQSIKTMQYVVEAETLEEAMELVAEGEYRNEAEEITEDIQWETETEIDGWEDTE